MGLNSVVGCVVIGSGPSLNAIDVRALAGVDTVAFNRSYIAWDAWGFVPTHYCCLDPDTFEHNVNAIAELIARRTGTRFFLNSRAARHGMMADARVMLLNVGETRDSVAGLPTITDHGNVGASSVEILSGLGYRRLALVGVDGRYRPARFNGRYRDSNYFQAGYNQGLWTKPLPDAKIICDQWQRAGEQCARQGVEIRNASPGSSLTCFQCISFEGALDWLRYEHAAF